MRETIRDHCGDALDLGSSVTGLERAIDGARQGRLAVVAGAGISMLPPSNLPSWSEFTTALLTAAVAEAVTAPFLDEDSIAAVRSLTPDSINTATLSESISKYVAGIGYFPVLTVLDGTTTNANHQALAELARLGRLRAIVTPNFDTLIERAFQDGRVPLADPVTGIKTGKTCTLIRLHGVATEAQSMIDTVGQKARGLPFGTHEALRQRLRDCRVMVVGFSGLDLDFAVDYLSLETTPLEGVTWVVRPKSAPAPQVMALRTRLGNRMEIVEGEMPALWRELGATVSEVTVPLDGSYAEASTKRVAAHAQALFDTLGAPLAVTLCMRLLDDTGQRERARQVYAGLARVAGAWSEPRLPPQATVLRALSSTRGLTTNEAKIAWQEKDVECCRRMIDDWRVESSKALAAIEAGQVPRDQSLPYPFDGQFDAVGWHAASRKVEDEIHFLLAIGLGNLAMSYARLPKLGSAERAMWEAFDHSLLAADLRALAGAWFAYGIIQLQADEPPSSILWYLLVAESAAVAGGNLDNAFAAAIMRGRVLMTGGEYDLAAECFERAAQRATLSARRELKIEVLASKAVLACRRHELSMSLDLFNEALVLAEAIPEAAAQVRWQRLQSFCNEPVMGERLLADCDQLLLQVRGGLEPDPVSGVPDASMIRKMKVRLTKVGELRPPPFVVLDDSLDGMPTAARLRQLLVNCEYLRDHQGIARVLRLMTDLKLQAGDDDPRAEELATAYVRAAERLDLGSQVDARLLFSQAAYRLGQLTRAKDVLKGLEGIVLAFDPQLEKRKRGWLRKLNKASPPSIHQYVLIRSLAEGSPALRFSAGDRQRTAASLAEVASIAAQVVICQLAQEYRDAGDRVGLGNCYALLARSAVAAGRQALAVDLDRIASELRASKSTKHGTTTEISEPRRSSSAGRKKRGTRLSR